MACAAFGSGCITRREMFVVAKVRLLIYEPIPKSLRNFGKSIMTIIITAIEMMRITSAFSSHDCPRLAICYGLLSAVATGSPCSNFHQLTACSSFGWLVDPSMMSNASMSILAARNKAAVPFFMEKSPFSVAVNLGLPARVGRPPSFLRFRRLFQIRRQ